MKRFLIKILIIFIISLCIIRIMNGDFLIQLYKAYHYDTFNIFHWNDIRFTSAEPNKNFVKTQYIIHNPKKFNAFLFGSSRVGNIPSIELPNEVNGINLSWYNMTYSVGIPAEHLMTLKTFLKNGVKVKMVILSFDSIAMNTSVDDHKKDLLRMPYQIYEKNKINFFKPYLMTTVDPSIIKQIDEYDFDLHEPDKKRFYEYGGCDNDFSLTENPDMKRYECGKIYYSLKDSYKDIEAFCELCTENDIKLILFTNPMYQTTYRSSVNAGYFDFLRKVANRCEFYNFSSLNNYTANPAYYYESSHYRPALGLIIEKYLFGSDEDREKIRREAGDDFFGIKVNAQNIDEVIGALEKQLN